MMSRLTRLRIALSIIREGDPDAWQCPLCQRWLVLDRCPHHYVRVLRKPRFPPPPPPPMPRERPYIQEPGMWYFPPGSPSPLGPSRQGRLVCQEDVEDFYPELLAPHLRTEERV